MLANIPEINRIICHFLFPGQWSTQVCRITAFVSIRRNLPNCDEKFGRLCTLAVSGEKQAFHEKNPFLIDGRHWPTKGELTAERTGPVSFCRSSQLIQHHLLSHICFRICSATNSIVVASRLPPTSNL